MKAALRNLRRARRFTVIALVSLSLGITLNLLTFSVTRPVLLEPLPYPETERLLDVSMAPPGRPEARGPLTPPLYAWLRDRTSAAFEDIGVFDAGRSANLAADAAGAAERLDGHRISATGLAAFGAAPLLGRLPTAADEAPDATPTMLLSHPVWQHRFGGRADVVNQTMLVDGIPTILLGVMPAGFGLLDDFSDAWFTHGFAPASPREETQHALRAVGRLRPGVSIDQAHAAVKLALGEYAQTFPNRDKGWTVELTPWRQARFGGLRQPLTVVHVAVGVLLLLLCANLAMLLAARPGARETSSFLPPTQRSAGTVLAEALTLSLGAAFIATVITWLVLPTLLADFPRVLPRLDDVRFDLAALAVATLLGVTTGLVFGMVPAWAARTNRPPSSGLRARGVIGAAVAVVLVAVQVAIGFVLVAAGGLALRAFVDLRGRDVGIDPSSLSSVDVHLPRRPYVAREVELAGGIEIAEYSPAGPALYDRVRAALQTIPGIVHVAAVGTPPFTSAPFVQFWIEEQEHTPDTMVAAQFLAVTENFFNTMGIRILRGRDFSPADGPDSPWVVLVNEAMARQHWPDGDPVGQRLSLTFHPNDDEPAREIVGLVADTRPFRGASEVPPLIYLLHRQQAIRQRASFEARRTVMTFVSRTTGDPLALGDAIRAAVGRLDPTVAVTAVRTVSSYLDGGQPMLLRFAATWLGLFALVTIVATAVGLYGVASLGLAAGRSVPVVLAQILAAVSIGGAAGFGVWRRIGDFIEPFLTNLAVRPSDAAGLALTVGVVLGTALVAGLVPAIRGARIRRGGPNREGRLAD